MKKTGIVIGLIGSLLIAACSTNTTDQIEASGKWTSTDIENAKNNAKFSADADPDLKTEKQKENFCDCWVKKVMELSPDPTKQSDIPLEKATEISVDCREKALK